MHLSRSVGSSAGFSRLDDIRSGSALITLLARSRSYGRCAYFGVGHGLGHLRSVVAAHSPHTPVDVSIVIDWAALPAIARTRPRGCVANNLLSFCSESQLLTSVDVDYEPPSSLPPRRICGRLWRRHAQTPSEGCFFSSALQASHRYPRYLSAVYYHVMDTIVVHSRHPTPVVDYLERLGGLCVPRSKRSWLALLGKSARAGPTARGSY